MSDEQDLEQGFDGADEATAGGGGEGGAFPALIVKILTYVAAGIGAVIFIVTVVVITVNIMDRGGQSQSFAEISEEYQGKEPEMEYFGGVGEIRGRTADQPPQTVIVDIRLGYDLEKYGISFQTELTKRSPELKDLVRHFFGKKTSAELVPTREDELKAELREEINAVLRRGKVKRIAILRFQVIEM